MNSGFPWVFDLLGPHRRAWSSKINSPLRRLVVLVITRPDVPSKLIYFSIFRLYEIASRMSVNDALI
jgi:hypothetical protein